MREVKHVLIVDDEPDIIELLSINLQKAGYTVTAAYNGRDALKSIQEDIPDVVVLDVMMPELSGTEVATRLRGSERTARLPIIMLTARADEVDQVVGLSVGADDYVTKPFSVKVLLARIEAVLRRAAATGEPPSPESALIHGPIVLNLDTHEAAVDGQPVRLTLTEFRLLAALMRADGRVLSRTALMSKAMGPGVTVTERTIDVHVTAIRKKLGDHAGLLQTVRGVGYRMTQQAESEEVDAPAANS